MCAGVREMITNLRDGRPIYSHLTAVMEQWPQRDSVSNAQFTLPATHDKTVLSVSVTLGWPMVTCGFKYSILFVRGQRRCYRWLPVLKQLVTCCRPCARLSRTNVRAWYFAANVCDCTCVIRANMRKTGSRLLWFTPVHNCLPLPRATGVLWADLHTSFIGWLIRN